MNQQFGNQIDRIHQNSLFQGSSQYDNPQAARIHQASMQAGTMANSQLSNSSFGGGFGGGSSSSYAQQMPNFGGQASQSYGGQMGMGMGSQVTNQQLQRIQQNSIFNGASQPDNAQVERIHQASMQNGTMANPQLSNSSFGGGFGGGSAYGQQLQNFGSGYGGQMMGGQSYGGQMGMGGQSFGGQSYGGQSMGSQMGMGMGSQVTNQQVDRIHQASMQNGTMANPQLSNSSFGGGFGGGNAYGQQLQNFGSGAGGQMMSGSSYGGQSMGGSQQMMAGNQGMNSAAFNSVMSADAGMQDAEGPSRYPASMYTGSNQYDNVNQSVFQQMQNMGQNNQMSRMF